MWGFYYRITDNVSIVSIHPYSGRFMYVDHVCNCMAYGLYQSPNYDEVFILSYIHDLFNPVYEKMLEKQDDYLERGASNVYYILPADEGSDMPINVHFDELVALIHENGDMYPDVYIETQTSEA